MRNGDNHAQYIRINNQKGVIAEWNGRSRYDKETVIYSPISGKAFLSPLLVTNEMIMGSFVAYNAYRHRDQNEWIVDNVVYLGEEMEIVPYLMRRTKLQLKLYAMVNRMDHRTSCAWLWNDAIGRIRIPPLYFNRSINPREIVQVTAMYDGEHEDVPWQAVKVRPVRDARIIEEAKKTVTTLLTTSDGWKVDKVTKHDKSTNGFYTVLKKEDSNGEMTAFAAWTDYARGEIPPSIGAEFEVTWFKQNRAHKLAHRAVLVIRSGRDSVYHLPNLPNRTNHSHNNHYIQSTNYSRVTNVPIYHGGYNSTGSTISSSPTQSEIEQMMDNSRIDDFRQRSHSVASITSSVSSSPRFEFMSLFINPQFDAWAPTEEERTMSPFSN